jgi:hypothetical protein
MVKFTKIVEKSLTSEENDAPSQEAKAAKETSKPLNDVFGKEDSEKKVEEVAFSDKLGELFGVDEEEAEGNIDG